MKHKFLGARILLVQNRLESGFQSCVKPFLVRPILKPPMSSNYFVMFDFLQTLEIKLEQHVQFMPNKIRNCTHCQVHLKIYFCSRHDRPVYLAINLWFTSCWLTFGYSKETFIEQISITSIYCQQ